MRRAARTDANHSEIIGMLRKLGFSVADTSRLGSGFPDCVIAKHGHTALVEIKDGRKPPSQRLLTEDEQAFRDSWKGQYFVVMSGGDVEILARRFGVAGF
jgi:hypothetical protein